MSCDTLQVMKFDDYNLMTDLGAGIFLLLIMLGVSEETVKAIALKFSTKFVKERDMREGSAIRPTWSKIYMLGLALLAVFLLLTNSHSGFTFIQILVCTLGVLIALGLSYGYGSSKKFMLILSPEIGAAPIEVRTLPDSDSIHPGTYPADTPPPRNSSTAD